MGKVSEEKFENFLKSNQPPRAVVQSNSNLTIKINEWTLGGEIKVERSYTSLKEATRNTPSHASNQPTIEEIIAIGNSTAARAANPQIPDNPTISGKPVPMVYSLHTHGEPDKVPVDTTIDAMRGHGRVHTTRGVDYQKTYGIKEGDIAIAVGGKGEKVAFRVGKQYEITPQLIQNPAYQQAWAKWEKHSHSYLTQTQASKSKVYGLFMEPLGDYANGKIVPFPPVQKQTPTSVNISPDSKDGLGAALSLATALAKQEGKLLKIIVAVGVERSRNRCTLRLNPLPRRNNFLTFLNWCLTSSQNLLGLRDKDSNCAQVSISYSPVYSSGSAQNLSSCPHHATRKV
ncbi:hypothetical protein NIES4075_70560 [Tolypothrix sp. NIES-4075]|uniref:hypothetical protein n=1 Tax=Tolypothrix sp. NIES-4075 TaxID=2005459 RepID=UPI000B68CB76|nr:hypothetical protein [Tolypothrix sp. NIES-4075]GAX46035.1 hypothetical protein NIES4075_70560 [Tolypothrix sp. NIES-4075]